MATFTLQRATKNFVVGDTVGAYVAESHWDATAGPTAAAVTTAVVGTDGTLAFTGLSTGTAYWAAHNYSPWKKQNFTLAPASSEDVAYDDITATTITTSDATLDDDLVVGDDAAVVGLLTVGPSAPTTTADGIKLGTSGTNVQLYRSAADTLRTPDAIVVDGASTLTGAVGLGSTLSGGATSDIAINTNKFTVAASSGNTAVAGTLGVTSDVAVNTNKFNVTASSGNTAVAGTLTSTGTLAATNAATVGTTLGVTGVTTTTGGIAGGTAPKKYHIVGPPVVANTNGTDTQPSITVVYLTQVHVPNNVTLTGAAIFNGSNVTDKMVLALFNSAGTPVANTATAGTAGSGTDAYQEVNFTGTYNAVGPATYWLGVYFNGTTTRFNTIPATTPYLINKIFGFAGSVGSQTFGTVAAVSLPTAFTADLGPFGYLY